MATRTTGVYHVVRGHEMTSNKNSGFLALSSEEATNREADVIASVLGTVRLTGARYCASDLSAPWAITFRGRENPVFHVVDRGAAWLTLPGQVPIALAGGDVVLLARGTEHTLADQPKRSGKIVDFADHPQIKNGGGPARWPGDGPRTLLVCGEFHVEGPTVHPLLEELPPLVFLRAGESSEWLSLTLRLLAHEALGMEPGAAVVMSRLAEVIFVQCLRGWLRSHTGSQRGWLQALREPAIGRALALVHSRPDYEWTVEELGRHVGLSRSVFAERFSDAVGEPPLSYLTRWRMHLAATRMLHSPRSSIKAIAAGVGYQSEAAFNRAFRKLTGQPPARWRADHEITA